jgi:hypothetical protein
MKKLRGFMNFFFKLVVLMCCGGLFAGGYEELDALQSATNRYIAFINQLGGHDADSGDPALICAPDCKKIFNGKLAANSRDEFISQLIDLKQNQGYHWAHNPAEILFFPESRVAVFRSIITIERAETCTAIVILRYTPEFLVAEINEVFNRLGSDEIPSIR